MSNPPPLPPRPSANAITLFNTVPNSFNVNQILLNPTQSQCFREAINCFEDVSGNFWYDQKSGLWGAEGGPAVGKISPNLPLPGSIIGSWASGTGTEIWANGREIHWMDLNTLPLPTQEKGNRWVINENGQIYNENDHEAALELANAHDQLEIRVVLNIRPHLSAAADFVQSIQKWTMGGDHIIEYVILTIKTKDRQWTTEQPFSCLAKFHEQIKKRYQSITRLLPPFPDKAIGKKRTNELIEKRQNALENYLKYVLSVKTIRENARIMSLLEIYEPIIIAEKSNKYKYLSDFGITSGDYENPFSTLGSDDRIIIGKFIIYLSRKFAWTETGYLQGIINQLLERLVLSNRVIHSIISSPFSPDFEEDHLLKELDEKIHWAILWEIILASLKISSFDARVHVALQYAAISLNIPLIKLFTIERECAEYLHEKLIEKQNPDEKEYQSSTRNVKIATGAAIGGGVLLVAGIIATPLIIPVFVGGAAFLASAIPLLGLGAAVTFGASITAAVAAPTLPLLFGAAGAGLGSYKANRLTEGISEYCFVHIPAIKCDENGQPLTEEEPDYSEPWVKVDEAEIKASLETPQVNAQGPSSSSQGSSLGAVPPPVNRSTKFIDPAAPPPIPSRDSKPCLSRETGMEIVLKSPNDSQVALTRSPSGEIPPAAKFSPASINQLTRKASQTLITKAQSTLKSSSSMLQNILDDPSAAVDNSHIGMRVCVCINGYVWKKREITTNWVALRKLDPTMECFGLRWESEYQQEVGTCLVKILTQSVAVQILKFWIISLSAVAAGLLSALTIPAAILLATSAIDNSWTVLVAKAKKVGKLLARTLLDKAQGNRPVVLIGHSLGVLVIFTALKTLAKHGEAAKGIVESVFMLGGACTSEFEAWNLIRPVVAGRIVNCFTQNDWVLGLVHRTAGTSIKIAGLRPIETEGVENVDLTSVLSGHLAYKSKLPEILEYLQVQVSVIPVLDPIESLAAKFKEHKQI